MTWIYKMTVPDEKSDDFVMAMIKLGLVDDEYFEVIEEGDWK